MAIKNSLVSSVSPSQLYIAVGQTAITTMLFCNTSLDTDATLDVYAVPYGSNVSPGTQIMSKVSIPAGETFVLDTERLILEIDDSIYAQASENLIINATISSLQTA
jgi:hypothetical protein